MAQPDIHLEYLKIGFSFGGALLGAVIGTPLIEWLKDQLGARRQWKTQRNEIVATVRLALGILKAFRELQIEAFGILTLIREDHLPTYSALAFVRIANFDFTLFDGCLVKLAALNPRDSRRSTIAQRLIQHLLIVKSYYKQLQAIRSSPVGGNPDSTTYRLSGEELQLVTDSQKKFTDLMRFMYGLYAPHLGIDQLSLIYDKEINELESRLAQYDIAESKNEFQQGLAQLKSLEEEERNTRRTAGSG